MIRVYYCVREKELVAHIEREHAWEPERCWPCHYRLASAAIANRELQAGYRNADAVTNAARKLRALKTDVGRYRYRTS